MTKKNQRNKKPSQKHCKEWIQKTSGQTMCAKHKPVEGTPPNAFKNCFNCRFYPGQLGTD
jgi:hypothetical protein